MGAIGMERLRARAVLRTQGPSRGIALADRTSAHRLGLAPGGSASG